MRNIQVRLKGHESAQCKVFKVYDKTDTLVEIQFISYRTLVIVANKNGDGVWDLQCSGTYSRTTAKQITWFLREYFPALTYQDMSAIAGSGDIKKARLQGAID